MSCNSETQQPVEPGKNSSRARKGQTLTRTWTRIVRPAQESEDGRKNESGSRAKRSFMEVDGSEVQNKKKTGSLQQQNKFTNGGG